MLDLQSVNSATIQLDSQGAVQDGISSHADSLVFERVVGSLASFATASGPGSSADLEVERSLEHVDMLPMHKLDKDESPQPASPVEVET